jgi:hypothetical protein
VRYVFLLDYPGAESALVDAVATRTPLRNFSMQTLGEVLLAQEKTDGAERQFRAADALSPAVESFGLSDVLALGGRFDEAARYLDGASRQAPVIEVERAMRRATLLIARGEFAAASKSIESTLPQVASLPTPNSRWRAVSALIALDMSQGHVAEARRLAAQHLAELTAAAVQGPDASLEAMEHLLYAASWAARLGLQSEARLALALAQERGALDRFPVRARLADLVKGELELINDHPPIGQAAEATIGDVADLWELHDLKARALRATGEKAEETKELRWLAAHGGLAYAQWIDQLLGQQARVLALLDAKRRLSERDGRK